MTCWMSKWWLNTILIVGCYVFFEVVSVTEQLLFRESSISKKKPGHMCVRASLICSGLCQGVLAVQGQTQSSLRTDEGGVGVPILPFSLTLFCN